MAVRLRKLGLGDSKALRRIINSRQARFGIGGASLPYSLPEVRRYISGQLKIRNYVELAILYNGRFVGTLSLEKIDKTGGSASIGYWIAKPYRNRGIATAAVGLALSFCFNRLMLRRVNAETEKSNYSSIRVLEKTGFEKVRTGKTKVHYAARKGVKDGGLAGNVKNQLTVYFFPTFHTDFSLPAKFGRLIISLEKKHKNKIAIAFEEPDNAYWRKFFQRSNMSTSLKALDYLSKKNINTFPDYYNHWLLDMLRPIKSAKHDGILTYPIDTNEYKIARGRFYEEKHVAYFKEMKGSPSFDASIRAAVHALEVDYKEIALRNEAMLKKTLNIIKHGGIGALIIVVGAGHVLFLLDKLRPMGFDTKLVLKIRKDMGIYKDAYYVIQSPHKKMTPRKTLFIARNVLIERINSWNDMHVGKLSKKQVSQYATRIMRLRTLYSAKRLFYELAKDYE